jgi:hypothetical protein
MELYTEKTKAVTLWPEPIEATWQMLPGVSVTGADWKRPDITLVARLLIGAVVNIPRPYRPWGIITWLATVNETSRETVYAIGEQCKNRLLGTGTAAPRLLAKTVTTETQAVQSIQVDENRLKRTILTLLFPGGVSLRGMQDCLQVALEQSRSIGYLSEFINEVGQQAGQLLAGLDYSPLGEIVAARDETFLGSLAFLLTVEPHSYTLLSGHVEDSCDSVRWGVSLAIDHSRGIRFVGLTEDAALYYAKSLKEARLLVEEFSVAIQKDVWHVMDKATKTVATLERTALSKLEKAENLFKKALKTPDDHQALEQWGQADAEAEALVELSDQVRFWVGCLCDALELVDWRSGEIRDYDINHWLLTETLQALRELEKPRIRKLVTYLEGQMEELLTFLDWLEIQLIPWQARLAAFLPAPEEQAFFQKTVAQAWRLNRAVTNGHTNFKSLAAEAQDLLAELIADDPKAHQLAEDLLTILERIVRTSCAAETVNSIIKPYLWVKRSFQSRKTAQNWLYLFILWFNMHPFQRSEKRTGKSPFQLAAIKVHTSDGHETLDWLAALGYPASA